MNRILCALLSCVVCGTSLHAQIADSTISHPSLITGRDALASLGVAVAVAVLIPADASIDRAFQRHSLQSNRGLHDAANAFSTLGDPGGIVVSGGIYLAGLVSHAPAAATLGLHMSEAVVLGSAVTLVVKGAVGRARPFVDMTDPHDFHPGRGFSNSQYASFPSGAATAAFAAATAASIETREVWPRAATYVTPMSYCAALLVGISRLYKNDHWASDVVAGAGIGTFAGVIVDRYNRAHPHNVLDRLLLATLVVPSQSGVRLAWTAPM